MLALCGRGLAPSGLSDQGCLCFPLSRPGWPRRGPNNFPPLLDLLEIKLNLSWLMLSHQCTELAGEMFWAGRVQRLYRVCLMKTTGNTDTTQEQFLVLFHVTAALQVAANVSSRLGFLQCSSSRRFLPRAEFSSEVFSSQKQTDPVIKTSKNTG